MKKLFKTITLAFVFLFSFMSLASCSSVADDYKNAGINFDTELFVEKSAEEVQAMLEEQASNSTLDITYVYFGSVKDGKKIEQFEEQAKQYHITTIYYIDSAKYNNSDDATGSKKLRDEIKTQISIHDASITPTLLAFVDGGKPKIDSSISSKAYFGDIQKACYEAFCKLPKENK